MPSPVLQIAPCQSKLIEHCLEKARPDFLPAILQRRKSAAVVKPTMTAFAVTAVESDRHATMTTDHPDFPFELMAVH
jgi:hypothetical protein